MPVMSASRRVAPNVNVSRRYINFHPARKLPTSGTLVARSCATRMLGRNIKTASVKLSLDVNEKINFYLPLYNKLGSARVLIGSQL